MEVSKEDLAALEMNGGISLIPPDTARYVVSRDSKSGKKQASNVKNQMEDNGEVLVHSGIPEKSISSYKLAGKDKRR